MRDWCMPVRAALRARATRCTVFFRDDDAGWGDEALAALLDRFARHEVPVDLAVIPAALSRPLAAALLRRARAGERIGVHQHGYAHVNHETVGRKCEFGPSRARAAQHVDLRAGRAILDVAFGPFADAIFTPPWNRCTADTIACLDALGFRALSRDVAAQPAAGAELAELPVAVDWCRLRGAGPAALAEHIAACVAASDSFGIMLHHAVMDGGDLELLDGLLDVLRTEPAARCVPMRALLPPAEAPAAHADDPGPGRPSGA